MAGGGADGVRGEAGVCVGGGETPRRGRAEHGGRGGKVRALGGDPKRPATLRVI